MKFIHRFLITSLLCISSLYAVGEPLNVAIESFNPPFILQGADKQIYGFDIDMMSSICQTLQRTCVYKIMRFENLIPSVINREVDVAVSSITITPERTKIVNFTMPYLLSYARFLTNKSAKPQGPFNLAQFNGKKIGIEKGSIYTNLVIELGIQNPIIVQEKSHNDLLVLLSNKKIDYMLLDNPVALYWAANSAGAFMTIGDPFQYGYGFGIAVGPNDPNLASAINDALLKFQNSPAFKTSFNSYFNI